MSITLPRYRLQQAGDTIVEILIVLAVLSLAISISYATANRSLQTIRQSQESSQATDLLQAQVEELRSIAGNVVDPSNTIANIYQSTPYCMHLTGTVVNTINTANPDYATDCQNQGTAGYNFSIVYSTLNGSVTIPGTFTATATWPDASGQGMDTSTLAYRIHAQ